MSCLLLSRRLLQQQPSSLRRRWALRTGSARMVSSQQHSPGQNMLEDLFPLATSDDMRCDDGGARGNQHRRVEYVTFGRAVEARRRQAKCSVLVQVRSAASAEDLFDYCTQHLGKVRAMHFHHNPDNETFAVRRQRHRNSVRRLSHSSGNRSRT